MVADTWLPFPGHEDRYEITRDGRVRSIRRSVSSPVAGGLRTIGGKELRPAIVKGYLAMQPTVSGTRRTAYIHRAIAQLFVPNPEGKPHVNHKDGCKTNNDPSNLEWCTHAENMAHAYATGLATAPTTGPGVLSPAAKLTEASVRAIRRRLRDGERQSALAAEFGVSTGTIGFIARGITWVGIDG